MATCSYCQQRKGKRSCPALGGAICSQCCGQHRLQDIVCPSDCMYLGGLAVIGNPVLAAAGFMPSEYAAAWDKLQSYVQGVSAFRNEALLRCFDPPEEPEQWDTDVAVGYLFYGHCDAGRRRMVDHFLAVRGRWLAPGEVAAMLALQRAWASLFEVASTPTGTSLELRDLLSGETVRVLDMAASGQLKKWDVIFSYLMPVRDHLEMTGAACLVPRQHVARVRAAIEAELVNERVARPGIPDRELVGSVAWAAIRTLREARREFQMPALQTSDGENLVSCKAHYATSDEAAVRAGLAGIAELEADDAAYRWFRTGDGAVAGDGAGDSAGDSDRPTFPGSTTLGHIRVSRDELMLETMSRERNERGRRLLEAALGPLIAHREDAFESFEAALGDPGKRSVHPPGHVPSDEERAAVGEYLLDHYRRWLDDPLPALGGKTPRDAARTDQGRAQVEELLKDIENTSLAIPGGEAVDFDALRRELGIGPDDGDDLGDLGYDAGRAPDPTAWLEMDDSLKMLAVEQHHGSLDDDTDMPNPRMHAQMHVIVENQLAGGEFPEVQATLERLSGAGIARHDAIHAIGSVMAEAIGRILKDGTAFDLEAAMRALDELDPEDWRSTPPP
jgi:hypothetical protein